MNPGVGEMKSFVHLRQLCLLILCVMQARVPLTYAANWGLFATDAPKAWEISKGDAEVVVGIIDTGIDLQHPLLQDNIWVNPGEIPGNGIDDDKNGFIDDIHGWNFANNNNDISDVHGHGTHVAGIIGARFDGKIGGIAPRVRIMPIKYYSEGASGEANLAATVKAIRYGVQMGAKVINYSAGGAQYSKPEFEAIQKAEQSGILFVAAAGNEGANAEEEKFFPAAYPLNNIIAVASLDMKGELLRSSNYGKSTVSVAAPGGKIQSTLPKGRFGYLSGTSQAAPFVTGTAALILSVAPELKPEEIKQIVISQVKPLAQLKEKVKSEGVLNALQAVSRASTIQFDILKTFYVDRFKQPAPVRHRFEFLTF